MPLFTDQTGRSVFIPSPLHKIVSLVPSQTELLFDLGLDASVVGITKFCRHPTHWLRSKQRIGGTKNPNIELIKQISPHLIIGNKEENRKEDIDLLSGLFPVWLSDVNNLDDALHMIDTISVITDTAQNGKQMVLDIVEAFEPLQLTVERENKPFKICYLIWENPMIAVGRDTFIDSMIRKCGYKNAFGNQSRYPAVTNKDIIDTQCDYIFLSSEPYPFKERHRASIQQQFPDMKVLLVDGEMFSWYGSRLLKAADYLRGLMYKLQYGPGTT